MLPTSEAVDPRARTRPVRGWVKTRRKCFPLRARGESHFCCIETVFTHLFLQCIRLVATRNLFLDGTEAARTILTFKLSLAPPCRKRPRASARSLRSVPCE